MNVNCYILCALGYAEENIQQARQCLQNEGIKPVFLGLKSGFILGSTGETVPTETLISLFIGQEVRRPLPDSLLVAGGAACGQRLLADPRVHLLIQQMLQVSKPVGFLHPISYPLIELLRQKARERPFLLLQEGLIITKFVKIFARQLYHSKAIAPS